MSEQLIWLKFVNPDDVYILNPLFDYEMDKRGLSSEKQCPGCGKSLYISFRASDLNDWAIVQPPGDIVRAPFVGGAPFTVIQSPPELLMLQSTDGTRELLLKGYSFKQPDYHSCQSDRESNEST